MSVDESRRARPESTSLLTSPLPQRGLDFKRFSRDRDRLDRLESVGLLAPGSSVEPRLGPAARRSPRRRPGWNG